MKNIKIKFGTDGWRDRVNENFTHYNVRRVAQGVARYMLETQIDESRGVAVGYDTRKYSQEFARTAAEAFAEFGISVYLNKSYLPTPALSHVIRDKDLAGAVMITASHNPPQYNGFKFFPYYGGPAFDEITKGIEELIPEEPKAPEVSESCEASEAPVVFETLETSGSGSPTPMTSESHTPLIVETEFEELYKDNMRVRFQERLAQLGGKEGAKARQNQYDLGPDRGFLPGFCPGCDSGRKLKIVVDSMHGAGCVYLASLLEERGHDVYAISEEPLTDYGGKLPEPLDENLTELKQAVLDKGADLGLALDGDADRFGVVSETGRYVSPNEIFAPLADYLAENVREKLEELYGPGGGSNFTFSRTIATTHAIDKIAESNGFGTVETPVGFKYLADAMLTKSALMGAEESGGLGINPGYPEKDGIAASLFLTEILEDKGVLLEELLQETEEKYGSFRSKRIDISLSPKKKQELLEQLEAVNPSRLAGRDVEKVWREKGLKLYLDDGSWCLVRPSGTEDLVRIYGEAKSDADLEDVLAGARELFGV